MLNNQKYLFNFVIGEEAEKIGNNLGISPEEQCDLVIITPTYFTRYLYRLAQHKNNYGMKTKIVSLDEIYKNKYFPVNGRDIPEKIKYFIKNSIEKWNISYVMLVGDINKIPIRETHMWDGKFVTDLYYADIYNEDGSFSSWDINGNGLFGEYHHNGETEFLDLHPDVGVGRLACRNLREVYTVVSKIISYEKRTYGQDWFKRVILCGGDTISGKRRKYDKWWNWTGRGGPEGEYANQLVAEALSDFNHIKLWTSSGNLNSLSVIKEINKGAGFVHFSGHGGPLYWFTTSENSSKAIKFGFPLNYLLFNGYSLPIIFFDGCFLVKLDYSIKGVDFPCLAWQLVAKSYGGAIASIGSSRASFGGGVLEGGSAMLGLYFFKAYNDKKNVTLSQMYMKAQNDYIKNFKDRIILQEYNLFGDPSLRVGGYPPITEGEIDI